MLENSDMEYTFDMKKFAPLRRELTMDLVKMYRQSSIELDNKSK